MAEGRRRDRRAERPEQNRATAGDRLVLPARDKAAAEGNAGANPAQSCSGDAYRDDHASSRSARFRQRRPERQRNDQRLRIEERRRKDRA